jgi:hypothetical protein
VILPDRGTARDAQNWQAACQFAIINAAVFFIFSLINLSLDVSATVVHNAAATIFVIGSVLAFYKLLVAGGALAAISFYVFGAGLAFGFGTVYATITDNPVYAMLFTEEQQARVLGTINLLNSLSVLIVLAFALLVCGTKYQGVQTFGMENVIGVLQILRRPLLAVAGVALFLQFLMFPIPEDLILRNALDKLSMAVPLTIVLSFSSWRKLPTVDKLFALVLFATAFLFGLLSAAKSAALFPLVAVIAGCLLDRRKVVCVILTVAIALSYSTLAAIVDAERSHWQYDPMMNSLSQRLDILTDSLSAEDSRTTGATDNEGFSHALTRFAHAPYQAFLINEWKEGRPGNSLEDSWTALIPRVLWPDKPIITRFGSELYAAIFRTDATSHQAPTYTAEAFWNYGWAGLIIVSIVLGLELGWFSRKWLELSFGRTSNLGILIFSLPVALGAWAVETWIAASYIGGFITLMFLIKAADFATASLLAPHGRNNGTPEAER